MNKMPALVLIAMILGLVACEKSTKVHSGPTADSAKTSSLSSGIDLSAVDNNVRPQDDFFRYVNGTWLANTEIPDDKSRYGIFNSLFDRTQKNLRHIIITAAEADSRHGSPEQKLGDMYNSYMNENLANSLGLSPLKGDLEVLREVTTRKEFVKQMSRLYRLGVDIPIGFGVSPDSKNPSNYALWLNQAGLTLPDRDYYFNQGAEFTAIRQSTLEYISALLSASGHENNVHAAEKILTLETKLAETQVSRAGSRDAEKNYNKRKIDTLPKLFTDFDWLSFASHAGISHADYVIIRQISYFESFGKIFDQTDLQTWKDYLAFKLLDEYAPRLSEDFRSLHFDFHSTRLNGIPEQRSRWKTAVASTSAILGELLGQQYVAKHFTQEAKAKMDGLVANVLKAYAVSLGQLDWMDDTSKRAALEKLDKVRTKIGYPNIWRDFGGLDIVADDLVGNYKRYNQFISAIFLSRIGKNVDPDHWSMTPQTINAYYSPTRNEIVFPAGILQPPFFSLEADDAVNYGAIGAVIGHEIGHGFDDQGSKYDGDGKLRSWWSDSDRSTFEAKGRLLVERFNHFEPIDGLKVNGELTLGENMGDLAGVAIGYKAYLLSLKGTTAPVIDGLSGAKRFFMGYAQVWRSKMREDALRARILSDPHAPAEYRVNGIVNNLDAFYQAFDVKEGDRMYLSPEDRVKIW